MNNKLMTIFLASIVYFAAWGKIDPPISIKIDKDMELNAELTYVPAPGEVPRPWHLGKIPVRSGTIEVYRPRMIGPPLSDEELLEKGFLARAFLSRELAIGGLVIPSGTEISFAHPNNHSENGPDLFMRAPWGTMRFGKLEFVSGATGGVFKLIGMNEGAVGLNAFYRGHRGWAMRERFELSGELIKTTTVDGIALFYGEYSVIEGLPIGYQLLDLKVKRGTVAENFTLKTLSRSIPLQTLDRIAFEKWSGNRQALRVEFLQPRKIKVARTVYEAKTRVFYDVQSGTPLYMARLEQPAMVNGAELDADIYFYPSGKVKSARVSRDQVVQNVSVAKLSNYSIFFWENGRLAQAHTKDSAYVKGLMVEGEKAEDRFFQGKLAFDPSGRLRLVQANYVNHGIRQYLAKGKTPSDYQEIRRKDSSETVEMRTLGNSFVAHFLRELVMAWLKNQS